MQKNILISFLVMSAVIFSSCNNADNKPVEQPESKADVVVNTILNRRSIRSYKPEQIEKSDLETILKCGINAPSALNKQTWELRAVQDSVLLQSINAGFVQDAMGKSMQGSARRSQEPGFSVFHGAPTVIFVAGLESDDFSQVNCGLLAQNILLSAEALDLGTCVIGSVASYLATGPAKENLAKLNLPEGYKVLFAISLGQKNESPDAKPRDESKVQIIE